MKIINVSVDQAFVVVMIDDGAYIWTPLWWHPPLMLATDGELKSFCWDERIVRWSLLDFKLGLQQIANFEKSPLAKCPNIWPTEDRQRPGLRRRV